MTNSMLVGVSISDCNVWEIKYVTVCSLRLK